MASKNTKSKKETSKPKAAKSTIKSPRASQETASKRGQKILVAYYSKTGNTKKIAELLASELKADIDEIIDFTPRSGFFNYFRSGRDAMKKRLTKIKALNDSSKYDLVIIGTPVWGWNMCPAVRTYILENKAKMKKVAFFSTSGGTNVKETFGDMEKEAGAPIAMLSIIEKELNMNNYADKLKEFCEAVRKK
jgi:flavodoxin